MFDFNIIELASYLSACCCSILRKHRIIERLVQRYRTFLIVTALEYK